MSFRVQARPGRVWLKAEQPWSSNVRSLKNTGKKLKKGHNIKPGLLDCVPHPPVLLKLFIETTVK